MVIKSMILLNLDRIPYFKEKDEEKDYSLSSKILEETSVLICNNTYSYRVGVLGWLFHKLSKKVCIKSSYLVKKINEYRSFRKCKFNCTDLEVLTYGISYINRLIPLLNLVTINERYNYVGDYKFQYGYENKSLPGLFSCNPYFDSGCGILSNIKPVLSDFVQLRWKNKEYFDDLVNKGILYNFYKEEEKELGCLIVTYNFAENKTIEELMYDIDDVMTWLSKLQIDKEEKYNVLIVGDLKMKVDENSNVLKLIIGENFEIKHLSNTSYLIHNIKNEEIEVEEIDNVSLHVKFTNNNEIKVNPEEIVVDMNNLEKEEIIVNNILVVNEKSEVLENYYSKSPKSNSSNESWTVI